MCLYFWRFKEKQKRGQASLKCLQATYKIISILIPISSPFLNFIEFIDLLESFIFDIPADSPLKIFIVPIFQTPIYFYLILANLF